MWLQCLPELGSWHDHLIVPAFLFFILPQIIAPWNDNLSKICLYDVPVQKFREYQQYMQQYTGHQNQLDNDHRAFLYTVQPM